MITGKRLIFTANAGDNNRLYGSVTSADIAEKLSELVGFSIDRRRIQLEHPIRDLGIYPVQMRLIPEVTSNFTVAVVREGEGWSEAETRAAKAATQKTSQGQ